MKANGKNVRSGPRRSGNGGANGAAKATKKGSYDIFKEYEGTVGHKFKLAHKRADKDTWSASVAAQRKRLVKILKQMIFDLEHAPATPEARATKQKPVDGTKAKANGRAKRKVPAGKKRTPHARHLAAA